LKGAYKKEGTRDITRDGPEKRQARGTHWPWVWTVRKSEGEKQNPSAGKPPSKEGKREGNATRKGASVSKPGALTWGSPRGGCKLRENPALSTESCFGTRGKGSGQEESLGNLRR